MIAKTHIWTTLYMNFIRCSEQQCMVVPFLISSFYRKGTEVCIEVKIRLISSSLWLDARRHHGAQGMVFSPFSLHQLKKTIEGGLKYPFPTLFLLLTYWNLQPGSLGSFKVALKIKHKNQKRC